MAFLTLPIAALTVSEAEAAGMEVTVEVMVSAKKVNGTSWDPGNAKPDLKVCVVTEFGTKCATKICRDSYACEATGLRIPGGDFSIVVYDVDSDADDLVGRAACDDLGECEPGGAIIRADVREGSQPRVKVGAVTPVGGCSCTFGSPAYGKGVSVFSANLDWSEARMNVNGRTQYFGYQLETEDPMVFVGPYGLVGTLKIKKSGEGVESTIYVGTLSVESENALTAEIPVRGACGC